MDAGDPDGRHPGGLNPPAQAEEGFAMASTATTPVEFSGKRQAAVEAMFRKHEAEVARSRGAG